MLLEKDKTGWELHTISNGRLSCENFKLAADDIDYIEKSIRLKFGTEMKEEHIMVSYDNWSGVFIMQVPGFNTSSSDIVIREIYKYLAGED